MSFRQDAPLVPFVMNGQELPGVSQIDPRFLIDPTMTNYTEPPNVPPDFMDTIESIRDGFYRGNLLMGPLVETIIRDLDSERYAPVEGYDPIEDEQLRGMEPFIFNFYGSTSPEETQSRLYRLQQRLVEQSKQGSWNALGYFMGATLDPIYALGFAASQTRNMTAILNSTTRSTAFFAGVGASAEMVRLGVDPGMGEGSDILLGAAFGAIGGAGLNLLQRVRTDQLGRAAATQRRIENKIDEMWESGRQELILPDGETIDLGPVTRADETPPTPDVDAPAFTPETGTPLSTPDDIIDAAAEAFSFSKELTERLKRQVRESAPSSEAAAPAVPVRFRAADAIENAARTDAGAYAIITSAAESLGLSRRELLNRIAQEDDLSDLPRELSAPVEELFQRTVVDLLVEEANARAVSPSRTVYINDEFNEIVLNPGASRSETHNTIDINATANGGVIFTPDSAFSMKFSIVDGKMTVATPTMQNLERRGILGDSFVDPVSFDEFVKARDSMISDLTIYAKKHNLKVSLTFEVEGFKAKPAVDTQASSKPTGAPPKGPSSGPDVDPEGPGPEGIPIKPLSAGASKEGATAPTYEQRLEGEAAVKAFNIEQLPNNPVKRVLLSSSARARDLVTEMLEVPLFQNKHFSGVAAQRSIERMLHASRAEIADVILYTRSLYDKYVMRALGRPLSYRERVTGPSSVISYAEFRKQITMARFSGNKHEIDEVSEAAKYIGDKIYDPLAKRAEESGIYPDEIANEIAGLTADLEKGPIKNAFDQDGNELFSIRTPRGGKSRVTREEIEGRLASLRARERAFYEGRATGIRQNYVPLIFRRDRIKANREEVRKILMVSVGMDAGQADELINTMTKMAPYVELGPDSTGMASAFRTRELFKNDIDLGEFIRAGGDKFIETDILSITRYYKRTFGTDLDIFEKFGSIDMTYQLTQVSNEYEDLLAAARQSAKGPEGAKHIKQLKSRRDRDLDDIRAMRDLLRGTYGLPADPNSGLSTAIRIFKRANALTMLTGALSAVPDIGRIVMTEGFTKTFGPLFEDFANGFKGLKLSREDARVAGEVYDMVLGTRAAMMADVGDGVGLSSTFEGVSEALTNFTFSYVNLLNPWTDLMKNATSFIVGNRILTDSALLVEGKLGKLEIAKLARAGIDKDMAARINEQYKIHGQRQGSVKIARLNLWEDDLARQTYADALARDIARAIVTPGLGDPPLWMNTELGGLIGQFKKFSAGAFERVTTAGLQERNASTLHGLIMMVGIGMLIDQFRADQIGIQNQSIEDRIVGGIDRSGVLGWLGDIVNAASTIVDPNSSGRQLAGVVAGPTGSQVANLTDTYFALTDGNETTAINHNVRRMLPWQNVFWLDSTFDALAGTR